MAQTARRIVPGDDSDIHDEPHLEGRRVTVRRIQGLVEGAGKPATEVTDEFDLDMADVYAALQYAHEHPDEIAAARARASRRLDAARERGDVTSIAELDVDTTE